MSLDGAAAAAVDREKERQATAAGNGNGSGSNGNGVVVQTHTAHRLRLNPSMDHKSDSYDDLQLDFSPLLFSSLERYLPPSILNSNRDSKVQYMREILLRYSPEGERTRVSSTFFNFICSLARL